MLSLRSHLDCAYCQQHLLSLGYLPPFSCRRSLRPWWYHPTVGLKAVALWRSSNKVYPSLAVSSIFRKIFAGRPHQTALGSSRIGLLDLQSKFDKYRTFLVTSVLQLMSGDGKQEFLCSAISAVTARRAWSARSRSGVGVVAVTPVTQGIQVPQVLQAPELPGWLELARVLSLFGDPWSPQSSKGRDCLQQPCHVSYLNYSPPPVVVYRKVQHKYHGTDGTCFEKVVYKGTLQSPCVLNYLCISKNMILQYI